ncbi:MAG: hypothetical protein Q8M20_17210 [Rhodocyclaceae bacterium]|nr:hypothetical protein [Rhodocyclaceae bacterium]MDZ4215511.1 hypothetical protein [Rhodocyclaceae bacterium]
MSQKFKLPPEIAALPPDEREAVLKLLAEKLAIEHVRAMRGQGKSGQEAEDADKVRGGENK